MLLIELKNIFESGESTAKEPIDWETKPNGFVGNFVEDGLTYQIRLIRFDTPYTWLGVFYNKLVYNIQFGLVIGPDKLSIHKTGKNNSAVIMSIVQNETWAKLQHEHIVPDIISLSISTDSADNSLDDISKRMSLYTRIANKIGTLKGYPNVYSNIPGKQSVNIVMSNFKLSQPDIAFMAQKLLNKSDPVA